MDKILSDLGFKYTQTGGGCDAYVRTSPSGSELYLTTDTGPDAPEDMADVAILTFTDTNGDVQYQREYPSVTAMLASNEWKG